MSEYERKMMARDKVVEELRELYQNYQDKYNTSPYVNVPNDKGLIALIMSKIGELLEFEARP